MPLFAGEMDLEALLYLVVGCGANDLAAVEGYFGGGPKLLLKFQPPNYLPPDTAKLGVKFKGGIRFVLLFFKADFPALDYTWWLVNENPDAMLFQWEVIRILNSPSTSPL